LLCGLRGILLGQPGGLFCLHGTGEGLVRVVAGGAYLLAGLGAGLLDACIPVGFGGADPRGGLLAGLADRGVPVGFRGSAGGLRLVGANLDSVQLDGDLLGCGVGFSAPLVGLGGPLLGDGRSGFGGGALLGGGAGAWR
jgi:hypothetical protein